MNKNKSDKGRFLTQWALAVSKQLRFESAFIITIFSPSKPFALHRIIASLRGQADEILSKTAEYYSALDAKGLALCGRAVSGEWKMANGEWIMEDGGQKRDDVIAEAIMTFQKARKIAPHAGVVKSVLRLFDELTKCDKEGILKDVRSAAEGAT